MTAGRAHNHRWDAKTVDTDRAWMAAANCLGCDPNLFLPERGADREDVKAAKRVCAGCTVQEQCLAYALRHIVAGIWGGLSEKERKAIRRRLRRAS